ncbi:putative ABC transporter solute-binding protein YclQ precursor [Corynebacterium occultum]|uniref:Putative ABC transporter solute-binding protein YclQ n=1 Tax=Corynebacterium occultum TaxID=2675219 RepID=A0A6B8WJQ4_9CORY|nr:ABC transporter substrate-binding protein [Corynebacterium occultum]QGU06678.1 putative ABC transporter solute-binding protein YclQ precursor [Corynebacterium occultum]
MAHTRFKLVSLVTAAALALASCSSTEESTEADNTTAAAETSTLSVEDNHGTVEVPQPATAVAATDNRAFELLDRWGVDLVAAPVALVPFTVSGYKEDESIADMGSHREPNLEALTAAQPDLIINGQRFAQYYDDISTLNPDAAIVELDPRDDEALDRELIRQAEALGEIFGEEEDAAVLVGEFEDALERAKTAYQAISDKTVMAVNVSGGNIGYIAPSVGRTYGPIFDLVGLTPALEVDSASDDHEGDDINVEAIAQSNPDILLVLDRDGGTNTRDEAEYVAAENVISENEALSNVAAIQDDVVYYAPADTYTNENIITYTEILNGLADLFEGAAK